MTTAELCLSFDRISDANIQEVVVNSGGFPRYAVFYDQLDEVKFETEVSESVLAVN